MQLLNDPTGLKVLIVDDEPINLMILQRACKKLGMSVIKAQSSIEAVAFCKQSLPDMIFMDFVMTGMSAAEATIQIKQIKADHWIPIILISELNGREDIVSGLKSGADDYLMKPLDFEILKNKICNITLVIRQQNALRNYFENAETDREFSIEVMNKLIRPSQLGERLQYWIKPMDQFCGDVIVAAATPSGRVQAVLADGTGHGLAAALNVIPVVEVFYGMNDKDLSIDLIAREMNSKIRKLMPLGRFVAAVIISMDYENRNISIWNGGIPFVAYISSTGEVLHQWASSKLALGLLDDNQFEGQLETFHCDKEGYLFACSDGLLEATNEDGDTISLEILLSWLKEIQVDKIEFVTDKLSKFLGNQSPHDDVAFLIAPFASAVN